MDAPLEAKTRLLFELVTPAYGQEIMLRASAAGRRLRPASVYPALRRLEARGLVRSWRERAARGPSRRLYELTVEGVRQAMARRDELAALLGFEEAPSSFARRERSDMEHRLRRSARVSAAAASLRDAMREARAP